jgi:hypothetical protein
MIARVRLLLRRNHFDQKPILFRGSDHLTTVHSSHQAVRFVLATKLYPSVDALFRIWDCIRGGTTTLEGAADPTRRVFCASVDGCAASPCGLSRIPQNRPCGYAADNSVEGVLRIQRTNEKTFRPPEWSADVHGDRR